MTIDEVNAKFEKLHADNAKRLALHNRPTRYELVAECGEKRVLLAYCMRQGRHTILEAMRKHGDALIALTGMTDKDKLVWLKPAKLGAQIGAWSFRFTGRTQRDAIGSELPWIGDPADTGEF